jgi:uncharacterized membrane protein YhfC
MTLGVQFIQFHIIATLINDGTFEKTMDAYKKAGDTATVEQMKSVAESLTHITPVSATLFAVDRIAFFFIQIALCVLIYKGVHKKLKKYLIFSMVLHLASYCVFYFSSGTDSMGLNGIIEVIALVVTIAIIYVAYVNYADIKKLKPEEDKTSSENTDDNIKGNSQKANGETKEKKTSISDIAKGRYDKASTDKEDSKNNSDNNNEE